MTVETEVNGDSKSTNERGSYWVAWFVRLVVPVQEIFVLSWLLQSAQYKIFFSSKYTISIPLSLSPSKLGWQPCWVACLQYESLMSLNQLRLGRGTRGPRMRQQKRADLFHYLIPSKVGRNCAGILEQSMRAIGTEKNRDVV
jgi:hypothetical protein